MLNKITDSRSSPPTRQTVRSTAPPVRKKAVLTSSTIRRLARKAGVKRISTNSHHLIREVLDMFLDIILDQTSKYMKYTGKSTITLNDIIFALKESGLCAYGF